MDGKNKKVIFLLLGVLIVIFIGLNCFFPDCKLFQYNLMEILTTVVVGFGIYYLTKLNDDIKSKNDKIENIVEWLKTKFKDTFDSNIETSRHAEYLHTFKYIDNKLKVLEKLSVHLNCESEIKDIKNEKQKLDDFITENIGQGDEYFLGESVKEKIPNILCNIETHLDNIILLIYDIKND